MAEKTHENIRLNGVKIQWAKLAQPSEMSGKYQVDIIGLTDEQVDQLKAAGCSVKNGADRKKPDPALGNYVTPSATQPVTVVDSMRKQLEAEELERIGNGTIANVIVKPYDWTFKNKKGIGVGLQAVQIVELKEYRGAVDMFDAEEGGYVAPAKEPVVAEDDVAF